MKTLLDFRNTLTLAFVNTNAKTALLMIDGLKSDAVKDYPIELSPFLMNQTFELEDTLKTLRWNNKQDTWRAVMTFCKAIDRKIVLDERVAEIKARIGLDDNDTQDPSNEVVPMDIHTQALNVCYHSSMDTQDPSSETFDAGAMLKAMISKMPETLKKARQGQELLVELCSEFGEDVSGAFKSEVISETIGGMIFSCSNEGVYSIDGNPIDQDLFFAQVVECRRVEARKKVTDTFTVLPIDQDNKIRILDGNIEIGFVALKGSLYRAFEYVDCNCYHLNGTCDLNLAIDLVKVAYYDRLGDM